MSVKGRWPRAVFYDSKTTLFDWGWSWASAAATLVEKYGSPVETGKFINTWVRFFESHHRRTAFPSRLSQTCACDARGCCI